MNTPLRPKPFFRSLLLRTSSSISSPPYPKWVSTLSTKPPPPPSSQPLSNPPPLDHLRMFFSRNIDSKESDYELALVSALKSCSSLLAISQGQQIHCLVLKSGLESNIFVHNSLLNMYAKCGYVDNARLLFDSCFVLDSVSYNIMIAGYVKAGRLDDAHQLFVKLPRKGCVSYTTMIMGFARNGYWTEAVGMFKEMLLEGVLPNEVTLASVISAYSHLGGIHNGAMIHALVTKLGIDGHVLISTNLVHMYSLCSNLGDAGILFEEMPEKNLVSWNVMLNGYCKAGFVDQARDLFERFPARDVVTWGTIIDGYVQVDRLSEAFAIYRTMLRSELGPNDVMIVDLVSACGRAMSIGKGQQIHSTIVKRGFDCYDFIQATIIHFYGACYRIDLACLQFELGSKMHLPSWNALIAGCVRNRMIDQARIIFNEMPERDVFSWSAMISGYTQTEQPDSALELFHGMVDSGVQANEITMVSVLSAIASLGTLEEGKLAHDYIRNTCIPLNDNLSAALIDMYAKCGSINTALEVFYHVRGKVSSISPWNAIICGLAMHGHAKPSLQTFLDLQRFNIEPNSITFIGVLTACCHAGLVEAGEDYFKSMKSVYSIDPDIKHYGCMVDLMGRAGRLEAAENLIRSMPMNADVVIWGTMLAACRTHGNMEMGEWAAEGLARLDTSHGPGRILLSNIYADVGRWEEAFLVRRAMQSQRMTKSPGLSGVV